MLQEVKGYKAVVVMVPRTCRLQFNTETGKWEMVEEAAVTTMDVPADEGTVQAIHFSYEDRRFEYLIHIFDALIEYPDKQFIMLKATQDANIYEVITDADGNGVPARFQMDWPARIACSFRPRHNIPIKLGSPQVDLGVIGVLFEKV